MGFILKDDYSIMFGDKVGLFYSARLCLLLILFPHNKPMMTGVTNHRLHEGATIPIIPACTENLLTYLIVSFFSFSKLLICN